MGDSTIMHECTGFPMALTTKDESRTLIAAILKSSLEAPLHYYGAMFPMSDKNSLATLCGLQTIEEWHSVLAAADFLKPYGNANPSKLRFQNKLFFEFLTEMKLQAIEATVWGRDKQLVFRIGSPQGDPGCSTFGEQVKTKKAPPKRLPSTECHGTALRTFAARLKADCADQTQGTPAASHQSRSEANASTLISPDGDSATPGSTCNADQLRHEGSSDTSRTNGTNETAAIPIAAVLKQPCCPGVTHRGLNENTRLLTGLAFTELSEKGFEFRNSKWFDKDCTRQADPLAAGKPCLACEKAKTKLRSERLSSSCQIIFAQPPPALFVTDEQLRIAIHRVFGANFSLAELADLDEDLPITDDSQKIAHLLLAAGKSTCSFTQDEQVFVFHLCPDCNHSPPLLLKREHARKRSVCTCCKNKKQASSKRKRRQSDENENAQTSHNSHTTITNLLRSPEKKRIKRRFANLVNYARETARKSEKVQAELDKLVLDQDTYIASVRRHPCSDSEVGGDPPDAFTGVVEQLREMMQEEKKGGKSEDAQRMRSCIIMEILNSNRAEGEKFTYEQAGEYVDGIREQIEHYSLVLGGKDKQVRFSPKVVRIAMSLWMRSPAAYEELRKSGWIITLPSKSKLERMRKELKVKDGYCTRLYMRSRPDTRTTKIGHLMCDETKLNEDHQWNTQSHETSGFVTDPDDVDSVLRKIICGVDDKKETAVEVNQWKFRATDNSSFECEFFYNGGDLDSGNLMNQFLHVLASCEMMNCQVIGMTSDGNKKNVVAMKLFSEAGTEPPADVSWLEDCYISCQNPGQPERRIYFWLCSTHQLKSIRNALKASHLGDSSKLSKRSFRSVDGGNFGWREQALQFYRDQQNASPKTQLSKAAIFLDGWSTMSAPLAKVIFGLKTLCEGMEHVCSLAKIKVPEADDKSLEYHRDCFRPTMINGKKGPLLGKVSARVLEIRNIIEVHSTWTAELRNEVALLEFKANVHDLFIEVLMKKDMHFCAANIDAFICYLKLKMEFFGRWKRDQLKLKDSGDKLWSVYFFHPDTWINLRRTVSGFCGYAKYAIEKCDVLFVPMLASNTSCLEAVFSLVKSMGGRDASSYQTRISCKMTQEAARRAVSKSSSYSADELIEDPNDNPDNDVFSYAALKAQNVGIEEGRKSFLDVFEMKPEVMDGVARASIVGQARMLYNRLITDSSRMQEMLHMFFLQPRLTHHFSKYIAPGMADFAVLAKNANKYGEFTRFSCLTEREELELDDACRYAVFCAVPSIISIVLQIEVYAVKLKKHKENLARKAALAPVVEGTTLASPSLPKVKVRKKTGPKKPVPKFAAFAAKFLCGETIAMFRSKLPKCLESSDAVFIMIVLESLWQLFGEWVADAAKLNPLPSEGAWDLAVTRGGGQLVTTVDIVSEAHRFLGSAGTRRIAFWYKELKRQGIREHARQERNEMASQRVTKNTLARKETLEEMIRLCRVVFCTRRSLGVLEKEYYNTTMRALNMGGLLLVSPNFFIWAKNTMLVIRASINARLIDQLGKDAQKEAFSSVMEKKDLKQEFETRVKHVQVQSGEQPFSEKTISETYTSLVGFAFHARSEVEWKRLRATRTDRSTGKEKKMSLRENLKGSGSKVPGVEKTE